MLVDLVIRVADGNFNVTLACVHRFPTYVPRWIQEGNHIFS